MDVSSKGVKERMYSIKNLKILARNNTSIFVILLFVIFTSFTVIFFSIGLFYQYSRNLEDGELDSFVVGFNFNDIIYKSDIEEFITQMPPELFDNISYITCFTTTQVSGIEEAVPVVFYLQYNDGKIEYSNNIFDPMLDDLMMMEGSFFTQEQYSNGDMVAVILGDGGYFQSTPAPEQSDTVTAFGSSYDVIGIINPNLENYYFYSIYVPFNSIPDDTEMSDAFYFGLNQRITQSVYEEFEANIEGFFGDRVTIDEAILDLEANNAYYFSVIIISVCIAILSALNISILYNYIIISRQRQLEIFRIYGGITSRLSISTANEIMLVMLPVGVISAVVYSKLLLPLLSETFPLITQAYTPYIYVSVIVIYCILSYLLNIMLLYKNLKFKKEGLICI